MKALIALALSAVADGLLLGSLSFGSARDVRLTARSQPPCRSHAYREVSRTPRSRAAAARKGGVVPRPTARTGHGETVAAPSDVEQRDAVWGHTWYPLQFEALADKSTPSSARLLGADVVFWFDHVQGYWAAALDACPHRLVPLSEGRVCPQSGDIECPYHGWTFRGADGACTRIPQLEPGVRIKADRAQATMLPVETRAGIIWCWAARLLHSEALPDPDILDALQVEAIGRAGVLHLDYFRDLPMDATILTENVLDPAHLPFTHHKTISKRAAAKPMTLRLQGDITARGFDARKGEQRGAGGVRFTAPHHVLSETHRNASFSDWNVVYAVPQAPGRSRVFVRVVFQVAAMPLPLRWIFNVAFRLPVFYNHMSNHRILEDDNIFLHRQDLALRRPLHRRLPAPARPGRRPRGLEAEELDEDQLAPGWKRRVYLPSESDALVVAYRAWLQRFSRGRGAPWATGGATMEGTGERSSRAALVERLESHTRRCAVCSKVLERCLRTDRIALVGLVAAVLGALLVPPGPARLGMAAAAVACSAAVWVSRRVAEGLTHGALVPPRNM